MAQLHALVFKLEKLPQLTNDVQKAQALVIKHYKDI